MIAAALLALFGAASIGFVAGTVGSRRREDQLRRNADHWLTQYVELQGELSRRTYGARNPSHDGQPCTWATVPALMPRVLDDGEARP